MHQYALFTELKVALVLLTRLPMPRLREEAFARQARSAWAWPLAGLVVGGLACVVGLLGLAIGLPAAAAAGLALATQIAATGAMHEDGLADTADGLWGGFTPERRLEIMRDSRIGTYGVLALVVFAGLRWVAMAGLLSTSGGVGAILAVAAFSRGVMPAVMAGLPPARTDGLSQGVGRPTPAGAIVALMAGAAVALVLVGLPAILPTLAACIAVAGLALLARARIGGQTGDILGASQQVAETVMLLGLLAASANS